MFVHSAGAEVALAEAYIFLFHPRGGARQQSSAALPTLSLRCAQVATPSRWGLPHRHAFPISALQARLRRTMLPAPTSAAAEPCHRSHQIPYLRNKTDRGRGSLHETEDARTQRRAKPPLTSHDCRPRAFCSPTRCTRVAVASIARLPGSTDDPRTSGSTADRQARGPARRTAHLAFRAAPTPRHNVTSSHRATGAQPRA